MSRRLIEWNRPLAPTLAIKDASALSCKLAFKILMGLCTVVLYSCLKSFEPDGWQWIISSGVYATTVLSIAFFAAEEVLQLIARISNKQPARDVQAVPPARATKSLDSMSASEPPVLSHSTLPTHDLCTPTSYSPEPPRTSPASLYALSSRFCPVLPKSSSARASESCAAQCGTWEETPFRDESAIDYNHFPEASVLGSQIPQYHYSLVWTCLDGRGVLKPVLSMQSRSWRGDRYVAIEKSTLREFSERTRKWVAQHVLQGLITRLEEVSRVSERHNLGLPVLLPLDRRWDLLVLDTQAASSRLQYYVSVLDGLQKQLQRAQQQPLAFQQQRQAQHCAQLQDQQLATEQHVQVLRDYQGLCNVLLGTLPGVAMGTSLPPAMLMHRVSLLAASCCCNLSPDPMHASVSDAEIILYLTGAFLRWPFWRFEVIRCLLRASHHIQCFLLSFYLCSVLLKLDLNSTSADMEAGLLIMTSASLSATCCTLWPNGCVLVQESQPSGSEAFHVSTSASTLPGPCMAFLVSAVPAPLQKIIAGIELCHHNHAGQYDWANEASCALVVRGVRCFKRTGPWACFEVLALFLSLVEQEFGAKIGGCELGYMLVSDVLAPVTLPTRGPQWCWSNFFKEHIAKN